ncbi:ATP-binding protein [Bacillus massiliglaciei]|uniref:ATP-binding protein n=1 Tax=Bacillus massiliglaciei TaxID=1816693 RepID=UPI000A53FC6F|nr:ATP-binding protein [Bacillus massiliglaciei]
MKQSYKMAVKITVLYIAAALAWIISTDIISRNLSHENIDLFAEFQQSKGWIYILVSSVILFLLSRNMMEKLLRSQTDLLKVNEQYRSLFNENPDAVLEIDRIGQIVTVNKEAEDLYGYEKEYFEGKSVAFLFPEKEKERTTVYLQQSLNGEAVKFEIDIVAVNGETKTTRCSFIPIIVQGEVRGAYMTARDITEMRRDEELMIISEKRSVIGHMAAAVAHEIRNPLTSLKGFVQLMEMTKEVNDEHLEIMKNEIEQINVISGEMLVLAKQQDETYSAVNVGECIRQVIMLMKAQANLSNIGLIYEETAKSLIILANPTQIKQVLINIIKNSIEAITGHGEIYIKLDRDKENVLLTISDSGIGIEPDRLSHVGEPFYSTKEKGTGLGMAVSFKIIHRHKGEITIESEKNQGTAVSIRIPLATETDQMVL